MRHAVGLIAVRMKSQRLKDKAIADLSGKPLIVRLFEQVRRSACLDEVILCTSVNPQDDVLQEVAKKFNISFFRGDENDVIKRFLDCLKSKPAELIVRITGDNPLTDPDIIDLMIKSHVENDADYTCMENLPMGIASEVISFNALEKVYSLAEDSSYSEYMTWYFTKNNLFKLNIIDAPQELSRPNYRLTVDCKDDYELLNRIYNKFDFDNNPPALYDIIKFLDEHPMLVSLNKNIADLILDHNINTNVKPD